MATCANCDSAFKEKPGGKGYFRYSIESNLPCTEKPAREYLCHLTGLNLSPSKKRTGQFLCPSCWSLLSDITKYNEAFDAFFGSTGSASYLGSKRELSGAMGSPSTSCKRPRFTSTPVKRKSKVKQHSEKGVSKWDTIITAIRARQYRRAIYGLYKATAGTKRSSAEVALQIVRKEIQTLVKTNDTFPLCKDVNLPNIADFSWDNTIQRVSESAPLFLSVLKGALTTKKTQETMRRGSNVNLKPPLGTAVSILLNARYPRKCSFFQTLLSVQRWRGRLKRETIKQLSRLGLCLGYDSTLKAIDSVRSNFDSAALKLKQDLEVYLQDNLSRVTYKEVNEELSEALSCTVPNMEDTTKKVSDMESEEYNTFLYSEGILTPTLATSSASQSEDESRDTDIDLSFEEGLPVEEESSIESTKDPDTISVGSLSSQWDNIDEYEKEPCPKEDTGSENVTNDYKIPGFTMCWDNVGKKVITRHPTENVKNKYINMALGYMALNRVSSQYLNWLEDESTVQASTISLQKFVPNVDDKKQLSYRMNIIVGRIVTRHFKWFHDNFSNFTTSHIVHEHSLNSSRKSLILNLGVFNEDPSSTQGAIGIYETLQKYIPVIDCKPYSSLVYGDGLSCERGNDANKARSNGLDPFERLEGLEPAVQEFHKEMLLLQDFYEEFFKSSSASDRGTVCQLKNLLNFRQVKADISDIFFYSWELMSVIVEGFVCLLVMQLNNIDEITSRPSSAPDGIETASAEIKQSFFEQVCNTVVEKVWKPLDTDTLLSNHDMQPAVICCGEDLDEDFIGCE